MLTGETATCSFPAAKKYTRSPLVLSRASCRPRFLPGFRTQWLLVAVTSNTSQPSSAAQITRESSRNRSDSLRQKVTFQVNARGRACTQK